MSNICKPVSNICKHGSARGITALQATHFVENQLQSAFVPSDGQRGSRSHHGTCGRVEVTMRLLRNKQSSESVARSSSLTKRLLAHSRIPPAGVQHKSTPESVVGCARYSYLGVPTRLKYLVADASLPASFSLCSSPRIEVAAHRGSSSQPPLSRAVNSSGDSGLISGNETNLSTIQCRVLTYQVLPLGQGRAGYDAC